MHEIRGADLRIATVPRNRPEAAIAITQKLISTELRFELGAVHPVCPRMISESTLLSL